MQALVHLFAFAVNAPLGSKNPLAYAERDAQRIERAFTSSRGRVSPTDTTTLVGPTVTRDMVRLFMEMLALNPPRHLIVYWCGHGNEDGIALADGLLTYRELASLMRAIRSQTRTLILDSCHAGAARRYLFDDTAGVSRVAGTADAAWLRALALAVPGLRLLAAVSEHAQAHEDPKIRGSRYTYALLKALRFARGDIPVDGHLFISDVAAARATSRILARRWPEEPRPLMWGPRGAGGRLPLMLSQAEYAVGSAAVVSLNANADTSTRLIFDVWDRRHVATHVYWTVTDSFDKLLAEQSFVVESSSAAARFDERLGVDASVISEHPWHGQWLRKGYPVELQWDVTLMDDHDHVLATESMPTTLRLRAPARTRAVWPQTQRAY